VRSGDGSSQLLIARPAGSEAFPRRNWAVFGDEVPIGEVVLTGWGVGTIALVGKCYSTSATPGIGHFAPSSSPREYYMRQNGYNIHIAKEAPAFTYSLDNNSFMFRSSRIWFWPYFGRNWPGYSLYKQNARFPIGKILQHRAFASDVVVDLPVEIVDTLQLFLLWLVVDRAQWRSADASA
jgi:hypothetical protein